MKKLIRLATVVLAMTTMLSLTFVSAASAQSADESQTQATISRLEDRVETLDARASSQEARADVLEARADDANNPRRAARLDQRAEQLDDNAAATRAQIARIEARIERLQARLGNAPAPAPEPEPQPEPQPAPDRILRVGDLNLSPAAQAELTSGPSVFGNLTRNINRLVESVSTNRVGVFSLADDGRIIDQNGQLTTREDVIDGVSFEINRRIGFPSQDIRDEFRPLAVNAVDNLIATLNG